MVLIFIITCQDTDRLNIYNILEPCYHGTSLSAFDIRSLPSSLLQLGKTEQPLAIRKRMFGRAWPVRAPVRPGIVPSWSQLLADVTVPCIVSKPKPNASLFYNFSDYKLKQRIFFVAG